MLWNTPRQQRRFLLFTSGTAVGLPVVALGWSWLLSLVSGQGGAIEPPDGGLFYLALVLSVVPAMLFLVGLMYRRSDHDR